jgi:hypothetical protein
VPCEHATVTLVGMEVDAEPVSQLYSTAEPDSQGCGLDEYKARLERLKTATAAVADTVVRAAEESCTTLGSIVCRLERLLTTHPTPFFATPSRLPHDLDRRREAIGGRQVAAARGELVHAHRLRVRAPPLHQRVQVRRQCERSRQARARVDILAQDVKGRHWHSRRRPR